MGFTKKHIRSFSSPSQRVRYGRHKTDHDLEKRFNNDKASDSEDSDDDDSTLDGSLLSSAYSSRVTSASHEPMLPGARAPSPSRTPRGKSRAYAAYRRPWPALCRCTPRWGSRLFSLTILAIMIVSMYGLLHQSRRSRAEVESGVRKPPPPPPVWESFPFLKRYHGGVRTLVSTKDNVPEYPAKEDEGPPKSEVTEGRKEEAPQTLQEKRSDYEDEQSDEPARAPIAPTEAFDPYSSRLQQSDYVAKVPCYLDGNNTISIPPVRIFRGVPRGMPDPVISSHDVLGIRDDICFDRFGRFGPYGLGYSQRYGGAGAGMEGDREGIEAIWGFEEENQVDFRAIEWGKAQQRCLDANRARFNKGPVRSSKDGSKKNSKRQTADETKSALDASDGDVTVTSKASPSTPARKVMPRTVILIRTWADFEYDAEDIMYIRSLIAELSLLSGAEYTIHFLIHIKDADKQIWSDEEVYAQVLNDSLPAEFEGMGTLWSEPQMQLIYPGLHETNFRNLGVYGVYRSFWLPAMYFAHQHPEYDYFWNFEMDMRYIGHWYELLTKTSEWAAKQPRKGLWERNARFYIPSEHGSWEDFSHMVRVQTEHGTASKSNMWSGLANNPNVPENVREEAAPQKPEKAIWGPEPPIDDVLDTSNDVLPPTSMASDKNKWGVGEQADLITFSPLFDPHGTNWILATDVTGYNTTRQLPPRRTAINTFGRLSKKLLLQMYHDTLIDRRTMSSEMWPASTALHHGFKAVYAPHPVYIDRKWPTAYFASIMNGGRNGASGGSRMSVFSDERQHNFRGTTWYYDAGFAPNLWKRWLGYKVDNDGGEQEELAGEGRMCLRSVLLHPVKDVKLIFEHGEERT